MRTAGMLISGFSRRALSAPWAALALVAGVCLDAAAATGDSKATAASITVKSTQQSKAFTFVGEKIDGEVTDWGIYYFKVSLKNGTGYTFWSTGASAASAYMGAWDADMQSVRTDFLAGGARDGLNFWMMVSPDDWWAPEDMPSGTYYLVVEGTVGETFTLNWVEGANEEPTPLGDPENPKGISVGTSQASSAGALLEGSYYFRATLTAGSKYKFWTKGGTEANGGLTLDVTSVDGGVELPARTDVDDGDDFNDTIVIVPVETAPYLLQLNGDASSAFTFYYQVVPSRLPAAHAGVLALGAPTLAGIESPTFEAGARNLADSGFFDPVIDQSLLSVSLEKGARYVFETTAEDVPVGLVLEVYDAAGKVLFVNRQKAPGSNRTLIAFQAPATATYWVGVCQDVEEPAVTAPCTLLARRLGASEQGTVDAWDAGDDALAGASGLAPVPGAAGDEPVAAGAPHGPHTLGLADWADWFRIDARKDITYKLQSLADAGWEAFALSAKVYALSGSTPTLVQTIPDLSAGGAFTASAHGSYYVQVFVQDGQGVDYGPYTLHALAYKTGTSLGPLQVNIGGPTAADGAAWSLAADGATAPKYPPGATVLLPAGAQTVVFKSVTGWSTPANQAASVTAGAVPTIIAANYNDTFDPKDDAPAAATALTPTNKAQKRSHSLWAADAADWFKLPVKPDTYVSLWLDPTAGAPSLTVYRANQTDVVAAGTDLRFLPAEAATYYVKVAHADPAAPADSAYTLNYLAQTVGTIKLEKAAYTFTENAPSAQLKVLRSAKDGRVRVRYWTEQDTAEPGVNYKPVKGVLEWKDGDSAAQTVTVPLLGNLYPTWDANKAFTVRLGVLPLEEVEEDELVPPLAAPDSAVVTLTETKAKTPGTVAFAGTGPDAEMLQPFANSKSPAVALGAGGEVTFWLTRSGGADGEVTVRADTVAGTAQPDVHYEAASETLVWPAGDLTPQPFTLRTIPTGEPFQAPKVLTVKLTAVAGGVKLGAAVVAVQVRDPQVVGTVEEWQAAGGAVPGAVLKPGAAGQWFFDLAGSLRHAPLAAKGKAALTLSLAGPGVLTFASELLSGGEGDNSTFTCAVGSLVTACPGGEEYVRLIPAGSQTVTFTVTRGAASPAEAEVYGQFADLGGAPFLWTPLPKPAPLDLADKAVVREGEDVTFRWDAPGHESFRLYVADAAAKLGTAQAHLIAAYAEGHEFCTSCGAFEPFLAGKTYYWRVDAVLPGGDTEDRSQDRLANPGPVRSFTVAAAGVTATADLVAAALAPYLMPGGEGFRLVQGVSYLIGPFDAPNGETFKATGLPAGLALKTVAGQTYLAGVPTKTNAAVALLQASAKVGAATVAGSTFTLPIVVEPLQLGAGAFNGLLVADAANQHESLGSLAFTATEAGVLSAKVLVAGKTYAFAGTGFAEDVPELENGQPGARAVLSLRSVVGGLTYTSTLAVTVGRGSAAEAAAVDTPAAADLALWIAAADGRSAREVAFAGQAFRDPSKVALGTSVLARATGYYTVSLPVREPVDDAPAGAGYLTLTLDAKGSAKLAGVLADGTAWSASGVPGVLTEHPETGAPALLIPVYTAKDKMAAAGWVLLDLDPAGGPATASGDVAWFNADPASTRGGTEGYGLSLVPTGGFYDALFNLQTYYLNTVWSAGPMPAPAAWDATYSVLLCTPSTFGLSFSLVGNAVTADKRALVKAAGSTTLYDFEHSVNPNNLTLALTRATGVFSGTFGLWYGNAAGTLQKEQAGLKLQGVLTPLKASVILYGQTPGLGFSLIPEKIGTRTWTGSHLFRIDAQEVVPDWSEGWGE